MIKNSYVFAFALFTFAPSLVFANESVSCRDSYTTSPLLTVADFNGDGGCDP